MRSNHLCGQQVIIGGSSGTYHELPILLHLCIGKGRNLKIEDCAASFEQFKQFRTNALVLKITDLDKEFLVCIYACNGDLLESLSKKDRQLIRIGSMKIIRVL